MNLGNILKSRLAFHVVRATIGSLFAFAGLLKAFDVRSFFITIQQLDILPAIAILPASFIIITCEVCFGLALIFGYQTRIAAGLIGALLLSFITVMLISLIHGNDVNCGCFGSAGSEQIGTGLILRDLVLFIACLWLIKKSDWKSNNFQ